MMLRYKCFPFGSIIEVSALLSDELQNFQTAVSVLPDDSENQTWNLSNFSKILNYE